MSTKLAQAARSIIEAAPRLRIIDMIIWWNTEVRSAGLFTVYDFPVKGYTRKAQVIADLERCAAQLEERNEDQWAARSAQAAFEALDLFAQWNVVDAAHDEALEFNAEIDEVKAGEQWDEWANQHDSRKTIAQMIESDHDEAIAYDQEHNAMREIKEVFDFSAAEHDAHYYQMLLTKRWKEQRVIMTTKDGAFGYILNDAIAGDMVKSVSLCTYTIDFRDGSVFDLRDGDWMPHGFYASVQAKRC